MEGTGMAATPAAQDPRNEKPDWAMSRRQRENARRKRAGLKPLRPIWPWVLLVLVLLAAGGGWYYQTQIVPTLPVAEVAAPEPEVEIDSRMQVNPYEYATVAPQTLRRTVRVTGTLQPSQKAEIAAEASGRVDSVTLRPGDRVAAGDVLLQVDVEQLRLQLDLQRSNAEATRAQLTLAEAQLERSQALVERGVATTSDLDQARTSVEGLRAQVSALTDQVSAAELSLSKATVIAPFAGIVSARSVEPGQIVTTGTPLFTVVDLSTVELVGNAAISASALIAPGQTVAVTVDGIAGHAFEGTVARINPLATEGSRTIPVYVTIANENGQLLGGMFATGEIVVAEAADAIAVPAEAVREDREGAYVVTIRDGTAVRSAVETGDTWAGDLVQITSGLAAGDVVITAALPELTPGDDVVLVE